jgi:hypothetical protein
MGSFEKALREQDRSVGVKCARFGVGGGVDIWRSDCVLTPSSADADRFGRQVPWERQGSDFEAYRVV